MKCTIGHTLIKNGKVVESKLFNNLLTYSTGNRDWALKAYNYILNDLEPKESFEKDEYGQPSFKDVLIKYDVFNKLDQSKVIFDIKRNLKVLDTEGKDKLFIDDTELHNISKKFNTEHPLNSRYSVLPIKVYAGDRGYEVTRWKLKVDKKTPLTQLETSKILLNELTNKKIRDILNSVNVSIGALNDLDKRLHINGVMDTTGAIIDGISQLIRIADGVNGEKALPEEFAHFAFEAVINTPLALRLIKMFESDSSLIQEVLQEEYEDYVTAYNNNTELLIKEAIGKLLATQLVNPVGFKQLTFLNRLIQQIKLFFKRLGSRNIIQDLNNIKKEAEYAAAELSNTLIKGDLNELLSLYVQGLQQNPESVSPVKLLLVAKEIKNAKDLLDTIIDKTIIADTIYSKRHKGEYSQKQKERIDKLSAYQDNLKDLQGIMYFFNDYLSDNMTMALNKIKNLRKDPGFIDNYKSSAKTLREAKSYIEGYREVVKDARNLIETLELEGDTELRDAIEKSLDSITSTLNKFDSNYDEMLLPLLVRFYQPFLQGYEESMKRAKKGPKTIEELFKIPGEDVGFADRFLFSMADNSDTLSRLLDIAVKKADSEARLKGLDYSKQLKEALMILEESGIANTEWMYERNSSGKLTGEFIKPNSNEYKKLNKAQRDYYTLVINMRKEAIEKLPPKDYDMLYLAPQVHKDWLERTQTSTSFKQGAKTLWETMKDPWIRREDDTRYGELINLKGEKISILPVHFVNKLADLEDLSLDVTSGMSAFMGMYSEYNEMNKIIDSLEITRDFIKNRQPVEYKKGQPVMLKIDYYGRKVEKVVNKSATDNRIADRIDDFFNSNVYKQLLKEEGNFGRIVENLLIKYPAVLNLSLNALTSISNVANATMMTNIEAVAQEHFKAKSLASADLKYGKLLPEFMGLLANRNNNSRMQLLNEMFSITLGDEGNFKNPKMREKGTIRFLKNTPLSFLQNCGEHYVHFRTALAMLTDYKLKDTSGKEVSILDALEISPESTKYNKKLSLKLGYTKLDGSEFTETDRFQLETKIRHVNKLINGAYNNADRGAIQLFSLGKAAMLFRKWMPSAYLRRFGNQKYDFESNELRQGYYRTMWDFGKVLVNDLKAGNLLLNTRYAELDNTEKANLKRALTEGAQFLAISLALALFTAGESDKDRPWAMLLTEYQLRRLLTELGAVFPLYPPYFVSSLFTITQSPMAGMSTLDKFTDLFNVGEYGDILQSGPYKGHSKFYKYIMQVTPVARQIERTLAPDIGSEFYK